jgi:hypothetical protein
MYARKIFKVVKDANCSSAIPLAGTGHIPGSLAYLDIDHLGYCLRCPGHHRIYYALVANSDYLRCLGVCYILAGYVVPKEPI